MKSQSTVMVGFILVFACVPGVLAQDNATLKAKVETLFSKLTQVYGAKDVQGYMSVLADDYQLIFSGTGRETTLATIKDIFKAYDRVREGHTILEITQSGNMIKVVFDGKLEGKAGNEDWEVIDQSTNVFFLVQENGFLKVARSAQVDKYRMTNVNGQTYKDDQIGFSFTAPAKWEIFPSVHPLMQGTVYALAPDKTCVAVFGFVNAPGASAQQAVEGDEASGKASSLPGIYKLFKSGRINISGHEGFQTESKFFIPFTHEVYRRRVYFNAGALLYVICFDAVPPNQWDKVKSDFQLILDSIKVKD